jgi:hypothetical protein
LWGAAAFSLAGTAVVVSVVVAILIMDLLVIEVLGKIGEVVVLLL